MLKTEFSTVGALRAPFCQPWPIEVSRLSSPPVPKLWHELHDKTPDAERRGSKYIALPRAIFCGVIGLWTSAGAVDGNGLKVASAVLLSSEGTSWVTMV